MNFGVSQATKNGLQFGFSFFRGRKIICSNRFLRKRSERHLNVIFRNAPNKKDGNLLTPKRTIL